MCWILFSNAQESEIKTIFLPKNCDRLHDFDRLIRVSSAKKANFWAKKVELWHEGTKKSCVIQRRCEKNNQNAISVSSGPKRRLKKGLKGLKLLVMQRKCEKFWRKNFNFAEKIHFFDLWNPENKRQTKRRQSRFPSTKSKLFSSLFYRFWSIWFRWVSICNPFCAKFLQC